MSNVPKLRFKEFSGEWEVKKLSDIGTFKNGLNKSKEDFGFGFPFVNLMDVFGKAIVPFCGFDLVNANEKDLKLYNLVKGDILFIRSSVKREGVGETAIIIDDLADTTYSGFLIRFREKKSLIDLFYKKYCFKTTKFRNRLVSLSTTSANTNINQESLSILTLDLPSKQEQEKIASFLTSVDKKIEQLTKKEELLKQYKKGVMQQIFSGEIRFKADDGSEFEDWEEKKLGDIIQFLSDYTANGSFASLKENVTYYNEENFAVLVRTTDLEKKVFNPERFTDQRGYDFLKKTSLYGGEIILANVGSIGKVYRVPQYDKPMTLAPNTYVISFTKNTNEDFIFQLMNRQDFTNKMLSMVGSSTLKAINKANLRSISIEIPCLEEQTKIANFLSSIDSKIEQVSAQLDSTKEFKKALLQQMFV